MFDLLEAYGKVVLRLFGEPNNDSPVPKVNEDLPSLDSETKESIQEISELRSDVQRLNSHLQEISSTASEFVERFEGIEEWADQEKSRMHSIYSENRDSRLPDPEVESEIEEGIESSIDSLEGLEREAAELDRELQDLRDDAEEISQIIGQAAESIEAEVSTIRALRQKFVNFKQGTLDRLKT